MDYKIFIPVLVSFALSAIMGPVIIPVLRNLKMGQTEREEGVKDASEKSRNANYGRRDHPAQYTDYFVVLHQKIIRRSFRYFL